MNPCTWLHQASSYTYICWHMYENCIKSKIKNNCFVSLKEPEQGKRKRLVSSAFFASPLWRTSCATVSLSSFITLFRLSSRHLFGSVFATLFFHTCMIFIYLKLIEFWIFCSLLRFLLTFLQKTSQSVDMFTESIIKWQFFSILHIYRENDSERNYTFFNQINITNLQKNELHFLKKTIISSRYTW